MVATNSKKSQLFKQDYSVSKSDAYWISKWILEQKTSIFF
jgi:hypothetical protein